ncbi:hypothetical protein AB5I39_04345 [Sphingomonas sp. MMS24-J45]|uniref:hypothetical protein n=1 Tax=Sphingomonas sp. MMS24-J45 TaxID=3238806 RepID=UPI00384E6A3E
MLTTLVATMLAARALPMECSALRQPLTATIRAAEAKRIARDAKQTIKPAGVTLILSEGAWRLVWATPTEAERGVYFYRRGAKGAYRLIDTWGGVIAADERADTVKWARDRAGHPSQRLAGCFADALIAEY